MEQRTKTEIIEGNYLPTPRTFVKIGKMPKAWGSENLTEMGITHLFSKDGNDWGSVDTAIFNADLKKKYSLTEETNNYVMSMALEMAPKCKVGLLKKTKIGASRLTLKN